MVDIAKIKAEMTAIDGISEEHLDYITEDFIADIEKNAIEVPTLLSGVWTGNHFVANGAKWSWVDQPGSQCGQTRPWTYTRKPGDSYGISGQCPQGYPWYSITVV